MDCLTCARCNIHGSLRSCSNEKREGVKREKKEEGETRRRREQRAGARCGLLLVLAGAVGSGAPAATWEELADGRMDRWIERKESSAAGRNVNVQKLHARGSS